MAKYRRVSIHTWDDDVFCNLSDDAKLIFLRLLTGPETTILPGVAIADIGALSVTFRKPCQMPFGSLAKELAQFEALMLEAVRRTGAALVELEAAGRIVCDLSRRVVFLPNGWKHNPPHSPNVVRAWRTGWDDLPDTILKFEIFQALESCINEMGEGYHKAFMEGFGDGFQKPTKRQAAHIAESGSVSESVSGSGTSLTTFERRSAAQPGGSAANQPAKEDDQEDSGELPTKESKKEEAPAEVLSLVPLGDQRLLLQDPIEFVFPAKATDHSRHSTYEIRMSKLAEWQKTFPNIDVRARLARIKLWADENPSKRKTATGWPRAISRWLDEDHSKVPGQGGSGARRPTVEKAPTQAEELHQLSQQISRQGRR